MAAQIQIQELQKELGEVQELAKQFFNSESVSDEIGMKLVNAINRLETTTTTSGAKGLYMMGGPDQLKSLETNVNEQEKVRSNMFSNVGAMIQSV